MERIMELSYITREEFDPYKNIALEEYLLKNVKEQECILYLWQNNRTVVIGYNQNLWKECKIDALKEDEGFIVRRLSGGGAVFHDMGNLNFTFLVRKDFYSVEKQTEVILEAVKSFGIPAIRSGRNDLLIEDKKFSGNAFYKSGDFCYHHGTILINGDKSLMAKYLNPSVKKLQSKAVDSVKSRVCNLTDYNKNITVETMKTALLEAMEKIYQNKIEPYDLKRIDQNKLEKLKIKFASWDWIYGRKIPFNLKWDTKFSWGELEINFSVSQGIIKDIAVFTDALDNELGEKIKNSLKNVKFIKDEMKNALGDLAYIMEDNEMYDLIVIGAGPGGYPSAIKAAELGKKILVIEKDHLGGTCLNRGCIPTKTLLHTTTMYKEILDAEKFGILCPTPVLDIEKMWEHKDTTIQKLRDGIEVHFKKGKIDSIKGTGKIIGENLVEVIGENGEVTSYQGENILIATGSAPTIPPIKGIDLDNVLTSDDIFNQNLLGETSNSTFQSVTIIGGGVIGMEMATIYSNMGCSVTVLEGLDKILSTFDKEISQNLKMILKKRNVNIITSAMVNEIKKTGDKLTCIYTEKNKEKEVVSDGILISVGRKSTTGNLFSAEISDKISLTRGYIDTNESFQTAIPNIYAIGDVRGKIQLAHMATAEGFVAVSNMFSTGDTKNLKLIPSCVYTEPEIASVGISADEAKASGIETISGKYIMSINGKSLLSLQERGFIKVLAEKNSRKIIGCQMMCARATDMIGEMSVAIGNELTVEQLKTIVRSHPTFEEGIGEALENMK